MALVHNLRVRRFFITINEGASCYENLFDLVGSFPNCRYFLIKHDNFGIEREHYHLILDFKNPKSFSNMCFIFNGAHVEILKFFNDGVQYLLHLNDPDKQQYALEDIITNVNREDLLPLLTSNEYKELTTDNLLEDINNGVVFDLTSACVVYGLNQVNPKTNLICKLILENKTR